MTTLGQCNPYFVRCIKPNMEKVIMHIKCTTGDDLRNVDTVVYELLVPRSYVSFTYGHELN